MVVSRLSPALAVVAALVALAGCGADDQEHAIIGVLTAGLTSQDPHAVCEGSLTPALLTQIYGGAAECVATEGETSERISQALSVEVSRVRIRDARATAVVTIHGGNHDGARGALVLARDRGRWRVSGLSTGLLRSQFEATLRRAQGLDPSARACITERMRGLGDAEFRRLALDAGAAGERRVAAFARRCYARVAAAARLQV